MSKRQINMRCFNLKSLVLEISSNVRLPKIFVNGLLHPCVKYFVCSKPQTIANALPLIGAYRVSADDKKREPASTICQPNWQQSGILDLQSQCF